MIFLGFRTYVLFTIRTELELCDYRSITLLYRHAIIFPYGGNSKVDWVSNLSCIGDLATTKVAQRMGYPPMRKY